MPELGLSIIDDSVRVMNEWLNDLAERAGTDKKGGYHVLRAGIHAIRDRMVANEAVHLAQQLPTFVRGVYFEGWQPEAVPRVDRSRDAWIATVEGNLRRDGEERIDGETAARAIMALLKERIADGELHHLQEQLPEEVAGLLRAA